MASGTQPDGLAVPAVHNALTNASINSTGPTERASTVIRPPHTVETRIKRQRESLRAKTQLRHSTQAAKANPYINPARASIRAATDRILPESTTATRPGRQFTVGNVGSNGLLYLRPVTRPDHFRSPPPSPFGRTPHSLAQHGTRYEARNQRRASSIIPESTYSSVATNPKGLQRETTQEADEEESLSRKQSSEQRTPPRPDIKSRPRSYSTIHDAFHRPSTDDPGSFRVNINRSSSGSKRPITPRKHSEPTLEVPIPSFKLASPSRHKSAGLRSSAQTRTTEQDQPDFDPALQFGNGLLPSVPHSTYGGSDVQHEAVPAPSLFKIRSRVQSQFSQRGHPLREPEAAYVVNINPSIFDIFLMRPDDPAAVRYTPGTANQIIAATPSRLVAYITSPTFLDYDLLSDFFLTFRAFMKAHELVSLLVMRLRWAVDKSDDGGRIARVRTFVALRHWILNYFLDDFVPDLALRRHFCVLVNGLHSYLKNREDGGGGDLKIVSELKKCWRRTCSLYWEDPQMTEAAAAEDKILPGGFVESPGADLLVPRPTGPVEKAAIGDIELARSTSRAAQKAAEAARVTNSTHRGGDHADQSSRGVSMNLQVEQPSRVPSAQSSQMGVLPYRLINQEDGSGIPLFPHPVQAAVLSVAPSAANSVKGGKPGPHRRQGSFSDALRNEPTNKRTTGKDGQGEGMKVPTMLVVPGCLIRGALYQPATPYFDTKPGVLERTMTPALIQDNGEPLPAHKKPVAQGNQGPGVRRLFGSMRKALGQKPSSEFNTSPAIPEEQSEPAQATMSPLLEDLVTSTRKPKHHHKARSQVRIDILAAMVQESFKDAVAKLEEHRRTLPPVGKPTNSGLFGGPAPGDDLLTPRMANSGFDKSLTIGSRSIVIVDDTGDDYMMSGANNPAMQSVASINMFDSNTYGSVQDLNQEQQSHFEEVENDGPPSEESSIAAHHIRKTSAQHPSVYVPTGYRKSSMAEIEQASNDESDVLGETAPRDSADDSTLNRIDSNQEEVAVLPDPETVSLYYPNDRTSKAPTEYEPFDLSQLPPIPTSAVPTLKRKPGGDLSKVEHVKSLEVQRPETTLTEFDTAPPSRNESKFSSLISPLSNQLSKAMAGLAGRSKQDLANSEKATPIKEEDDALSLHRRSISLMVTHSSQPNLRPSFEAEVAKFRDLPDDEDGGVESALARLEGTYVAPERSTVVSPASAVFDPEVKDVLPGEDEEERKERHHHEHVNDIHPVQELAPVEVQVPKKGSKSSKASPVKTHRPVPSQSAVSEVSNSSVPLLERGLGDRGKTSSVTQGIDAPAATYVPEARKVAQPIAPRGSMVSAIEPPKRTSSARPSYHEITPPKVPSKPNSLPQSFLLNESDESDDNSDDHRRSQSMRSFFDDEPTAEDNLKTPTRTGHIVDELKTSAGASPHLSRGPLDANPTMFRQGLPTPRHSPTPANATDGADAKADTTGANNATSVPRSTSVDETAANGIPRKKSASSHASAHLPFILAHTPELLAQQFTLIEKDALDEIDWRELIEMRWAQTSPSVKDWVEYLLMQQASPSATGQTPTQATHQQNSIIASGGVDLVIARFNLVVRWVQSEILLCASQQDRINTITHFIRIAAECRSIRNYATMYQMTVALLSSEIARLGKSWENIGKKEIDALRDLEKLVQPVRNFGELRAEMEGGGVERDEGCIPFVGIYTRSLVTNAQKPATMTIEDGLPPTSTEPLVNFDRHQTAASIVKALLRLLEASSRYRFTAEPVVLSRCLWLGCLSVEDLNNKSRSLEQ